MNRQLLMVSSVTFAMKGQEILSRNNIPSSVQKTPKTDKNTSCGYSIAVIRKDKDRAMALLNGNGITITGIMEVNSL